MGERLALRMNCRASFTLVGIAAFCVLSAPAESLCAEPSSASPLHSDGATAGSQTAAIADRLVTQFEATAGPVLTEYCVDCHNADFHEGDVRLDDLDPDMVRGSDADRWHAVLDMINGGEMPPEDSAQPSDAQRRAVVEWITRSLDAARAAHQAQPRSRMRRLTKQQYANTLSDLLRLPIDFGENLPEDSPSELGFKNSPATQQTTSLHLQYYESIAREALGKAIVIGDRPDPARYRARLGRGVGRGHHAAEIGGYQSAPVDREHVRVEVLDLGGSPTPTNTPKAEAELRSVEENIGVGMRGSSSDRYHVTDDGMILYGALPHRETGSQAWQGPSPNLKLLLRRCAPTSGPFVVRVTASRAPSGVDGLREGLLSRRSQQPLAQIDEVAGQAAAADAVVLVAGDFHALQNMTLVGDTILADDVTQESGAKATLHIDNGGLFQIDAVCPAAPDAAMTSIDLHLDGTSQHLGLPEEPSENGGSPRVVTIAHANLMPGQHELRIGGRFFAGLSRLVVTPLPEGHPVARQIRNEQRLNSERYAATPPVLRVFAGARTDDGMDYETLGEPTTVRAAPGAPEVYEFHGYLENLPVPTPDPLETGSLSNIQIVGVWNDHLVKNEGESGPPLLIESIEYESPHYPAWPPESHASIFFEDPERSTDRDAYTRRVIHRFMARAYRGPVDAADVDRYFDLWKDVRDEFATYEEGVREALVAVLCSPRFLYVDRPSPPGEERDTLAVRLAYFLWNSPPDERLEEAAAEGCLADRLPETVDWMLHDPRAWRFVRTFTSEWLRLDRHEAMSVNTKAFPDYTRFVKRDMRDEAIHFLHYALTQNLSARVLIDSEFAMLNQNLAEFYGVDGVSGPEFRPVALDRGIGRGGLLSLGAFLVGHSDGTQSHPIKRAVWLKERILGDPPPSPPPNVPELDPETPGFEKLNLKDQLELHRDKASCADCHRKIDPFGVVFEEYDAVGRLRTRAGNKPIDAASTLPDGQRLQGVADMKRYLADERYDDVLRSFVERLFAYATGLDITYAEEPEIDRLVLAAREDDRLASIVLAVTQTASFLEGPTTVHSTGARR